MNKWSRLHQFGSPSPAGIPTSLPMNSHLRKLGQFARTYPDVVLDVTTEERRVDLVAGRYDGGIHYGEFIEHDMVAVRVSPDHRPAIVGSSVYFDPHPPPSRRAICCSTAASTSDTTVTSSIAGSSTRASARWRSRSMGH